MTIQPYEVCARCKLLSEENAALRLSLEAAKTAVVRFVHGEDKRCLVCGGIEECDLRDDPHAPCKFDPTPMELYQAHNDTKKKLYYTQQALTDTTNKLQFLLDRMQTSDGMYAFPDGDVWNAGKKLA